MSPINSLNTDCITMLSIYTFLEGRKSLQFRSRMFTPVKRKTFTQPVQKKLFSYGRCLMHEPTHTFPTCTDRTESPLSLDVFQQNPPQLWLRALLSAQPKSSSAEHMDAAAPDPEVPLWSQSGGSSCRRLNRPILNLTKRWSDGWSGGWAKWSPVAVGGLQRPRP